MYKYEAELCFRSYIPDKLEKGMLFMEMLWNQEKSFFKLESIPEDKEEFMSKYGTPIELFIADEEGEILATPNEIGWMEIEEEIREITVEDLNYIVNVCLGWIEIEIYEEFFDEDESIIPNYIEEKVIISFLEGEE